MSVPERTCVVTHTAAPPGQLVRVLIGPEGRVEVDYHARLGGRGAWLCPVRDVIAAAEARPGLLARALEVEACDTSGLLDRVRAANLRTVGELLSLAARAGALASGGEQVVQAVRCGDAAGLLVAADASPQSIEAARGGSEVPFWTAPWDRDGLGHRIGKGPRAVVAFRRAALTRALMDQLRRMENLR